MGYHVSQFINFFIMSLDGGPEVPRLKFTPVGRETVGVLNTVFNRLGWFSNADSDDWNFEGASFRPCNEGLLVRDVSRFQYGFRSYKKPWGTSSGLFFLAREFVCAEAENTISILIPWTRFKKLGVDIGGLIRLFGQEIAMDITYGRPVSVGEEIVGPSIETAPARDEDALVADQVGRQIDAALARVGGGDSAVKSAEPG